MNNHFDDWKADLSLADRLGFNPYYYSIESGLSDHVMVNGRAMINLAANNYLGLADDPRVKSAMIQAVSQFGSSMCGTPIATGYLTLMKTVEAKLARMQGLGDALLFPSCYQANSALFLSLAGREDLVIVDHYAHASLLQGIKAAPVKIKPFLHNNLEHLEKMLAGSKGYRHIFVVTESVFSTEGSIAPFDRIVELCGRYNAIPVIDDSHGIGVLGKKGYGVLEHFGISQYEGIYTASTGKALASSGGFIAGPAELMKYLRYSCGGYIYSTALSPASVAGLNCVLKILESDFQQLGRRLWHYRDILLGALTEAGWKITGAEAPIIPLHGGSTENTVRIARALFASGILCTPFVPPSVPPQGGKVRLIAGANLSEKTIAEAAEILKTVPEVC